MDIHVGDVLKMKKAHPCGSQEWLVLRVGMDFRNQVRKRFPLSAPGGPGPPGAENFFPKI